MRSRIVSSGLIWLAVPEECALPFILMECEGPSWVMTFERDNIVCPVRLAQPPPHWVAATTLMPSLSPPPDPLPDRQTGS